MLVSDAQPVCRGTPENDMNHMLCTVLIMAYSQGLQGLKKG
jgi:hypothetical protein